MWRIITILLIVVPIGNLAFRAVDDTYVALCIAIPFAVGVTELVNLVYTNRREEE